MRNFVTTLLSICIHFLLVFLKFFLLILILNKLVKVVRNPCQKITLFLLKSKSVRVIVPESCF